MENVSINFAVIPPDADQRQMGSHTQGLCFGWLETLKCDNDMTCCEECGSRDRVTIMNDECDYEEASLIHKVHAFPISTNYVSGVISKKLL